MVTGTDRASAGEDATRGQSAGGSFGVAAPGAAPVRVHEETPGDELRRARTAAGWARWRLARESGVPKEVIAGIEKGEVANPDPEALRALREALERPILEGPIPGRAAPARRRSSGAPRGPVPVPRVTPHAPLNADARRALGSARREAGLSAARVERLCGLRSGVVSSLEAGTRGIGAERFEQILAAIRENAEPEPAGIGGKLRRARYAAGLSQERVAFLSGVGLETIREIESGRTHRPKEGTLRAIYGALGRPVPEWEAPPDAPRPGQRSKSEFVGARLALARVAAGLTQKDLAKRIGVSDSLVSVLERDEQRCVPDVLAGLREALEAHGFPRADPRALASDLGARVRRRREALGLSEEALAGVARVPAGDVGRAERGSAGSREAAVLLARLARALRREEALTWGGAPPASGGALGAGLRSARIGRGLSPGALAERVGLTRGMVLAIEEGWQLPSVRTLEALGDALGGEEGTAWFEKAGREARGRQRSKGSVSRRPPADNPLSRELRAVRLGQGLTLRELGERAGVSVTTVHLVEVEGRRPEPATLAKLEHALGRQLPRPSARRRPAAPGGAPGVRSGR